MKNIQNFKSFNEDLNPAHYGSDEGKNRFLMTRYDMKKNPYFETGDIVKYTGDWNPAYGKEGKVIGIDTRQYLAVELFDRIPNQPHYNGGGDAVERFGAKIGHGLYAHSDDFEMVEPVSQIKKGDLDTRTWDNYQYKK